MLVRVLEKDLHDLVEVLDYERSLDTHTVARREMKAKFGGRMRHLLGIMPVIALCASILLASSVAQAVDGTHLPILARPFP